MPRRRPPVRLVALAGVLCALLAAAWLGGRDLPIFEVDHVTVVGATGPQGTAISSAVTSAARAMTTTHLQEGELEQAVQRYPVVSGVQAERVGLRGVRIRVHEHEAVAAFVPSGGTPVPVAADGTLLRGAQADDLPSLPATAPAGERVTDRRTRDVLRVLGLMPEPLRERAGDVVLRGGALAVRLTDGPLVDFGDLGRPRAKWASLTAVLADPASRGASEIDLQVPERPTATGLPTGAAATTTTPGATVDPTSSPTTAAAPAAPAAAASAPSTTG